MSAALLSAGLTAGANLIGGLFGASDQRKARAKAVENYNQVNEWNAAHIYGANAVNDALGKELAATPEITDVMSDVSTTSTSSSTSRGMLDVKGMMAAAEASGFNPVTFLRNGGLQAFMGTDATTTSSTSQSSRDKTTRTGHNAAVAAQMRMPTPFIRNEFGGPAPAPSFGTVLSGALASGLGAYQDSRAVENQQAFQREMLNTQLNAAQKAQEMARSFYVPSTTTSGGMTRVGGPSLTRTIPSTVTGRPTAREVGPVSVTNPWAGSNVDPVTSDAAAVEERYGEIAAEVGGLRAGVNDFWYNTTGLTAADRWAMTQAAAAGAKDFFGGLLEWSKQPLLSR